MTSRTRGGAVPAPRITVDGIAPESVAGVAEAIIRAAALHKASSTKAAPSEAQLKRDMKAMANTAGLEAEAALARAIKALKRALGLDGAGA